jgi:hypothetical protein
MASVFQTKQVFLTYAHHDKKKVRTLYRRLTRHHIHTWFDEKELLPGQIWKHEIHQAILCSDAVIVCLSQHFIKHGGYRHEEVKIALSKARSVPQGEIFLIPVRLDPCDVPELLQRLQYVNLFEEDGYKKLLRVLQENRFESLTK